MNSSSRLPAAAALLALSLFLFFWGLGNIPFYTKGEPREALEVWEEIHAGTWILPMRNGHELPSKPPLFHWLGGLTALATGKVDELAVRFPSALLATGAVLLVFWLGAVKWGPAAGLYAGGMLATSFEWLRSATTARVDMTLTAFLIGSFVALDRIVSVERPSGRALFAFYVCMGLAALGKGPVGILLPGLVLVVYLALRRDLGRIWSLRPIAGGSLTLAIAGSWYVAAIAVGGESFVYKQLWVENFGRFFAADASGAGHVHPWYYMVGAFFAGFAPWSFFTLPLAFYLYHCRRHLEARGYLFPLVWFGAVFLFYAVSESKRSVYLLPIYPAATLLLGAWWTRLTDDGARMPVAVERVLQIAGALAGVVVLSLVAVLIGENLGAAPLDRILPFLHPKDQANIPVVQQIIRGRFAILAAWVAVLAPVIALFIVSVHRKRWVLALASMIGFVASSTAVVNAIFHPELAWRRTFKPFMEVVRGVVQPEDELHFYRAFDYGAVFYSRRHIPALARDLPPAPDGPARSYVLLWESVWDELDSDRRSRLEMLRRSEGTGPKGQNRLIFALRKPAPPAEPPPVAAAPDQNG